MTAQAALELALKAGARIIPDRPHPRLIDVPHELVPLITQHREAIRELVLVSDEALTDQERAYKVRLWHWWGLTAQGETADHEEAFATLRALDGLTPELGPRRAGALRRTWAEAWQAQTGCCPTCGERGPLHTVETA